MSFAARSIPLYGSDPYPNASVALDFVRGYFKAPGASGGSLSTIPGWTYSRTGTEYASTSSGLLVPFASGVPAVTDLGLQVWEARTNYAVQSQTFDNAWGGSPTGLSASAGTAPDGANTAYSWNGGGRLFLDLAANGNGAYSNAVYAKALSGSPTVTVVVKDRVTDTVHGTTSTATNGLWQRVVAAGTTVGASAGVRIEISVSGGTALIWGATSENASFAGPYIPTTSASATRGASAVTITFSGSPATAKITYGTGAGTVATINNPTSPLNLGASSGGAWVDNVIQRAVLQ